MVQMVVKIRAGLFPALLLCAGLSMAQPGGDFSLTDHHGKVFNLSEHRGRVVALFFGFTFCPEICPDTLVKMAEVNRVLNERSEQLTTAFITVDPQRDTVARLAQYVPFFNSKIVGLTGTPAQISIVADQYNVSHRLIPGAGNNYTVDHSADLYILDRAGRVAGIVPYGMPVDHIVKVIGGVMQESYAARERNQNPPTEFTDLQGREQSTAQWHGKSVLINLWASWCVPCRTELPSLNHVWQGANKESLQMVAINVGESVAAVSAFVQDYPIDFPVWLDESAQSMKRWQVSGFPTTIMIGKNGEVLWKVVGDRVWDSENMLAKIRNSE